jgi:hypothetical protein
LTVVGGFVVRWDLGFVAGLKGGEEGAREGNVVGAWFSSVLDEWIICMILGENCLVGVGEVEVVDAADEGWEGVGGRGEEG